LRAGGGKRLNVQMRIAGKSDGEDQDYSRSIRYFRFLSFGRPMYKRKLGRLPIRLWFLSIGT
jgi:hypothetical protein